MQTTVAHQGAGARAELSPGGVLVVEFTGLLLAPVLAALKARVVAAMRAEAAVIVADYSAAVLALSGREIERAMAGLSPEDLPGLPAVVVPPDGAADALHQAALQAVRARAGVWRAVVPGQREAISAARQMLALSRPAPGGRPRQ